MISSVEDELDMRARSLIETGRFDKAIHNLRACLAKKEDRLYRHNEELARVRDSLARCLAQTGHFDEAQILLK